MPASKLIPLKPGMVLSDDLKNFSGQILLPKGTRLTPKHIKYLKAWGLAGIQQAAPPRENPDSTICKEKDSMEPDPQVVKESQAEASKLFRHVIPSHPAAKELIRLCAAKKIKNKMEHVHES